MATTSVRRLVRPLMLFLLAISLLAIAGCAEQYANKPKPPAVFTVTFFVGEDQIAYSPEEFGAGPTRFVLTNQTGVRQKVTVSTDRDERSVEIDPHQTATFKKTIEPGFLSVEADKSAADPAEIEVGPERESSQNDLDLP